MVRFILRRFLEAIPVLLIIATMAFFMVKLVPGGPFDREKNVPEEVKLALEAHYGMDKPLPVQYANYLLNLFQGDLGPSTKYQNRTVNELIGEAFPVSMELGFWSLLVALGIGVTAGVIAAIRPNTTTDYVPMALAMVGICVPMFVMGPLLQLIFGIQLQWYNASGWFYPSDRVLPALTLGIFFAAYIARMTRGGMIEVLNQDYIRTAKAKGVSASGIIFKHSLKGGLIPVVSFLGPAIARMLTGSFIVETIFFVPGLGKLFVMSAFNRDFTMVIGTTLFYSTFLIVLNLVVDIVLVWINPKLKFE